MLSLKYWTWYFMWWFYCGVSKSKLDDCTPIWLLIKYKITLFCDYNLKPDIWIELLAYNVSCVLNCKWVADGLH